MGQVYITPDRQDLERELALLQEYGGAFEYSDFFLPAVLDDRRRQEEIIESYAKYRTDFSQDTLHGAFYDVCIHSEDSLIREVSVKRVYQSMEIAKRMGLRGVVFHTGLLAGCRIPLYLERWKQENVKFFAKLAQEYPKIQIFMENMFDEDPGEISWLGEALRDVENFGICLDYAHGAVSRCPEARWVESLAPYIRHMHINDNDLKADLHQPVGTGQIDWSRFQDLMMKNHIHSTVLVEVKGYEAHKKSLEYLQQHQIFPFCK